MHYAWQCHAYLANGGKVNITYYNLNYNHYNIITMSCTTAIQHTRICLTRDLKITHPVRLY